MKNETKEKESSITDETEEIWKIVQSELRDEARSDDGGASSLHPAFTLGLSGFFLLNVGALLSLPPVLRGKGAPYLPTFSGKLDTMFSQLRREAIVAKNVAAANKSLTFVDLGSGDGRVVFRAAREGIFKKSIGYEINPLLHLYAQSRRVLQAPKYWSTTEFMRRDLWKVDLSEVDVVAVYGLHPIMDKLGVKLKEELKPGAVVLSNVFSIPGWKQSPLSSKGVYVYSVPSCWEASQSPTRRNGSQNK